MKPSIRSVLSCRSGSLSVEASNTVNNYHFTEPKAQHITLNTDINPLNAEYISGVCYSVRQILFVVNNKHATKFAAGSPLYWTPAVNRLAITSIMGSGSLPNFSRNPLLWVPAVKGLIFDSKHGHEAEWRCNGWYIGLAIEDVGPSHSTVTVTLGTLFSVHIR